MLLNNRNLSILLKEITSSNIKGMALPNRRDKVIRSMFMKESTMKAFVGEIICPVAIRVKIAKKVATVLEVNSKLSTIDNRPLFLRRIQISVLKHKKPHNRLVLIVTRKILKCILYKEI